MINQYLPNKVEVRSSTISQFCSNDEYMDLGVELANELLTLQILIINLYKTDELTGNKRAWNEQEAISVGLMVRIHKLFSSLVDNICQNRMEICQIIIRCLLESMVNLVYLIKSKSSTIHKEFIQYSYQTEKKFFAHIQENIAKNDGEETNIEKRMQKSILNSLQQTDTNINTIEPIRNWGENTIFNRFKNAGAEELYPVFYLQSHAIHGNWTDLIHHHIRKQEDGGYEIKASFSRTDPRCLLPFMYLIASISEKYLLYQFSSSSNEIDSLLEHVKSLFERARNLDKLHEDFLNTP